MNLCFDYVYLLSCFVFNCNQSFFS